MGEGELTSARCPSGIHMCIHIHAHTHTKINSFLNEIIVLLWTGHLRLSQNKTALLHNTHKRAAEPSSAAHKLGFLLYCFFLNSFSRAALLGLFLESTQQLWPSFQGGQSQWSQEEKPATLVTHFQLGSTTFPGFSTLIALNRYVNLQRWDPSLTTSLWFTFFE